MDKDLTHTHTYIHTLLVNVLAHGYGAETREVVASPQPRSFLGDASIF